jgi:hypothetical protein
MPLQNLFGNLALDENVTPIKNRFSPSIGAPTIVNASGLTTLHTPAAGQRIRFKWVGMSTPPTNGNTVFATIKLGGESLYSWYMGAPGAFAHGAVREGPVDGLLEIDCDVAQPIAVNIDVEEFV